MGLMFPLQCPQYFALKVSITNVAHLYSQISRNIFFFIYLEMEIKCFHPLTNSSNLFKGIHTKMPGKNAYFCIKKVKISKSTHLEIAYYQDKIRFYCVSWCIFMITCQLCCIDQDKTQQREDDCKGFSDHPISFAQFF